MLAAPALRVALPKGALSVRLKDVTLHGLDRQPSEIRVVGIPEPSPHDLQDGPDVPRRLHVAEAHIPSNRPEARVAEGISVPLV